MLLLLKKLLSTIHPIESPAPPYRRATIQMHCLLQAFCAEKKLDISHAIPQCTLGHQPCYLFSVIVSTFQFCVCMLHVVWKCLAVTVCFHLSNVHVISEHFHTLIDELFELFFARRYHCLNTFLTISELSTFTQT